MLTMRQLSKVLPPWLAIVASACSNTSCHNEVWDIVANPTAQLLAIVFSRNCGATTGENAQVSIISPHSPPDGQGNALIMTGCHHIPQSIARCGSLMEV
jgi:hypothetical protein